MPTAVIARSRRARASSCSPTCTTLRASRRRNDVLAPIGEAAARVGARVIVDEVYLDTVFDDAPGSSVHLGPAFVATSSLTKVYGLSALRCGWIIADDDLARRIWRVNDLYGNVQPFPMDLLASAAFDRLPALRARSRALLDANRAHIRPTGLRRVTTSPSRCRPGARRCA